VKRALKWVLAGIGITIASIVVFVLAAWLFPGDPGRSYMTVCITFLVITLAWRLFGLPMR